MDNQWNQNTRPWLYGRRCEQDVLKDYLTAHEVEVIDIMMALYDKDVYMKLHDSRKKKEGAFEAIIELVHDKLLPVQEAAKRLNMTEDEIIKATDSFRT